MSRLNCLDDFQKANAAGDISTLHQLRQEIFEETVNIVKTGRYNVDGGEVVLPPLLPMMQESVMYEDPGAVEIEANSSATIVEVLDSDSLLAGKRLLDDGFNPAVLNFANRNTPGGGVEYGAGAQEENIFRRSNLFMSLYQFHHNGDARGVSQRKERYPMDRNTGGAYSPDVTVFRGLETDGYPLLEQPYHIGIVTVAAMNRPELKSANEIADHLVEPVRRKIRTIFRIALKHGHDAIVLGAWGCGAFRNPPRHIARLFHEVMEEAEFKDRFRKVVFAIVDRLHIDIRAGKTGNLAPFKEEFSEVESETTRKESKSLCDGIKGLFSVEQSGDEGQKAFSAEGSLTDRLKGMFWGLVVGDCLGSPIQFMGKDLHPYITEMERCETFNTPPGYWTDDSSMAFCIAESAVRLQRYSLEDIANNFVRWYKEGFWSSLPYAFDVGNATHVAIRGIERGNLKNGSEDSQGNGSIMRFAPSFILNYGNHDKTMLYEISDLTHDSQKVRETVALMAQVCEEHINGGRTSVKSIYNSRDEVNNSGWAVSTLQAALWAFKTTSTFEDGMVAAVNLGGDADTIGAVYGQIAGAYYGFNAIPERWLCKIKDRAAVNALIEGCVKLNSQA